MLAAGMLQINVAKALGIPRRVLYDWATSDPEYQALRKQVLDAVVGKTVQDLRQLSEKAIEALDRGVSSTHREQVVSTGEGDYEIVSLADNSLAVQTADKILKRIPEFAEQHELAVGGSLEERLRELDARGDVAED